MDDKSVIERIDALAREEHELFKLESSGHATQAHQERLQQLQVTLDQCWDFLRQRRAKEEYGLNPDEAQIRDEKTIKGYVG
jgi:Protein of unknown function (DUF2630)